MNNTADIADLAEIARFWTKILRDEDSELKDKLKVTELLSKYSENLTGEKDEEIMDLEEMYEVIQKVKEAF